MDRDQETRVVSEAETFGVALFAYLFQMRHREEHISGRTAGGSDEDSLRTASGVEDFFTTDVGEAVLLMCHLHGNWFSKIFTLTFPEGLADFPTFRSYVSKFAHKLYDGNEIFNSLLMVSAMIIEMCLYCLRPYAKTGSRFAVPAGKCWSSIFLDLFAEDFFKFGGWQVLQKVSHDKARIYEDVKQKYPKYLRSNSPFIYLVDTQDLVLPERLAFEYALERVRKYKAKLEADGLQQNSHIPFSDHDLPAEFTDYFKGHPFYENKYTSEVLKSRDVAGYAPSVEKLDSNTESKCPSDTKSRELGAIAKTAERSEYSFTKFGTINYTDEKDILEIFKVLVNLENADDGKCISQLLCSNENVQILMSDTKYLRLIKETVEKPSNKPDTKQLVEDAKNIIVKASFTAELMSHPPENQPIDIPFESRDNLEQNLDLQNLQKTSSNDDLATSMEILESNIVGKPSSENNYSVLGAIPKTTIKTREILQTSDNELSLYDYDLLYKFKDIVKNENEDGLYLSKLLSSSGISQHLMNDHYLNLMKDVVIHKKKPDTKQLLEHARRIIEATSPEILENELLENQPHNIASRSDESLVQKLDVQNRQILEKGNEPPENLLNISTPESESQNPFENIPIEISFKAEGELLERPDRSEMGKEPSPRQKPEQHVDCDKRNMPEVTRQYSFENKSNISLESEKFLVQDRPEIFKEPSPMHESEKHVAIDVDCHKRNIESPERSPKTKGRTKSVVNEAKNQHGVLKPWYMGQILEHLNSQLGTTFPVNNTFEWAYIHSLSRNQKIPIIMELLRLSEKLAERIEAVIANIPLSSDRTGVESLLRLSTSTREEFRGMMIQSRFAKGRAKEIHTSKRYTGIIKGLFLHNGHFYDILKDKKKEIEERLSIGGTRSGGAGNIKVQTSQRQKPYNRSSSKSSPWTGCTAEGASYHPGNITEPPGMSSDKAFTQTLDVSSLAENLPCISGSEEKTEFLKLLEFMFPIDVKQQSVATEVSCSPSEGTAGASLDTETTELEQDTAQSGGNARKQKKKKKSKRKR